MGRKNEVDAREMAAAPLPDHTLVGQLAAAEHTSNAAETAKLAEQVKSPLAEIFQAPTFRLSDGNWMKVNEKTSAITRIAALVSVPLTACPSLSVELAIFSDEKIVNGTDGRYRETGYSISLPKRTFSVLSTDLRTQMIVKAWRESVLDAFEGFLTTVKDAKPVEQKKASNQPRLIHREKIVETAASAANPVPVY